MSAAAIIGKARDLGISLWVDRGTIRAKGPQPAIDQILPDLRRHKPELVAALAEPAPDPAESSVHWMIIQPAERIEKFFTPEITRGELAQRYPGALLVSLPDIVLSKADVPRLAQSCKNCRYLRRPGATTGCAGDRGDLPRLYGASHPLRELPSNGGVDCEVWKQAS